MTRCAHDQAQRKGDSVHICKHCMQNVYTKPRSPSEGIIFQSDSEDSFLVKVEANLKGNCYSHKVG